MSLQITFTVVFEFITEMKSLTATLSEVNFLPLLFRLKWREWFLKSCYLRRCFAELTVVSWLVIFYKQVILFKIYFAKSLQFAVRSPQHSFARFLNNLLEPVLKYFSKYVVKDSFTFVEIIWQLNSQNTFLSSFDVKCSFTGGNQS